MLLSILLPASALAAESTLRLACKVFDVETATVSLLTGERIYLVGACGAFLRGHLYEKEKK